jgi:hypothetical protein
MKQPTAGKTGYRKTGIIFCITSIFLVSVLSVSAAVNSEPYKLWWSIPGDDEAAIEIDDGDIGASDFQSRWQLVLKHGCDKAGKRHDEKVRELRIERLAPDGSVRDTRRCARPIADWKKRLGARLYERLDDVLDAHIQFLRPKKIPTGPLEGRDGGTQR